MPKEKIVLPGSTDIAAVYGLLNTEERRQVRQLLLDLYNIPKTTFYRYLRTNRIPRVSRKIISACINHILKDNTQFTWDYSQN